MNCRHCTNTAHSYSKERGYLCDFHRQEYADKKYKEYKQLTDQEEAGTVVGFCIIVALVLVIAGAMLGG